MRMPFTRTTSHSKLVQHGVLVQMRDALLRRLGRLRPSAPGDDALTAVTDDAGRTDAAVLAFPIRGEALLANLANTLRERRKVKEQGDDPFLMTLSRSPRARLSIDSDAYVEFHAEDGTFHLKIDAVPVSRLTLETSDFVMLVKFVLQYLAERHGDPEPAGDPS
jgi:hypothetical protein